MRKINKGMESVLNNNLGFAAELTVLIFQRPRGSHFSASDFRDIIITKPTHPNAWGSVFHNLHRSGFIKRDGYAQSITASRKGSVVTRWMLL